MRRAFGVFNPAISISQCYFSCEEITTDVLAHFSGMIIYFSRAVVWQDYARQHLDHPALRCQIGFLFGDFCEFIGECVNH